MARTRLGAVAVMATLSGGLLLGSMVAPAAHAALDPGSQYKVSARADARAIEYLNTAAPVFAENDIIYIAYWKPKPGDVPQGADNSVIRTAVLLRARYDGSPALKDVTPIFDATSETDGPSAARLAFGRDGKIYMALGVPG